MATARRQEPRAEPRVETLDDRLDKEALTAAADGVIEGIKPLFKAQPNRLVRTFTRPEIESLAAAAIARWIGKRVEQAGRADVKAAGLDAFILMDQPAGRPFDDPIDDLF